MKVFQKSLLLSTSLLSIVYGVWAMDSSLTGDDGGQKGGISGQATSKPQGNKILAEENISSIKQVSDLYYGEDDISDYIDYVLQSRGIAYLNSCTHLLTSNQYGLQLTSINNTADHNPYFVAISSAIDTVGLNHQRTLGTGGHASSTNLDYFLDKNTRPKDNKEEILEELLQFKSTSDDNYYSEFLQKIRDIGEDHKYDLTFVEDMLAEVNQNKPAIDAKLQDELEKLQQGKKDIFDELMPHLHDNSYGKILFPYNITQFHWLTGEIWIYRQANAYIINVYAHDPYGKGKMGDSQFNKISDAIRKRIQECHPDAQIQFQNLESPYDEPRQSKGDTISCGVIVAEDIIQLITGPLNNFLHPAGTKELREGHLHTVQAVNPNAPFINRNKSKAAFITKYENELGDLPALFNKLKYPKNQGSSSNLGIASNCHYDKKHSSNETLEKVEEISRQISRIKENHKKIESDPSNKDSLLKDVKESLLRISWRVDEIPSYDKFHMGAVFPEKNWIFLGHLSNVLNSSINPQQLEVALLSLSKEIEEIEKAIVIINKILKKEDLKKDEQIKLKLPCLENFVGFYMDQLLLKKINSSINSIISQNQNESDIEKFLQNDENQRAIFRVFEVIGECAKYISRELKDIYPSIPWLDFSPEIKKNILTIIRNKFHHDREKIELVFKYEKNLFKSILCTVFPYILQETTKVFHECDSAFHQLNTDGFTTLRDSVHKRLSSNVSESTVPAQLSEVQKILEQITDIMLKQEDGATTLKGWKIKELLSYIKEEDDSIYDLLFKKLPLPDTEDNFIEVVRHQLIDPNSFPLDLEAKFRKAYTRLQGKKISQQQVNEAFQQGSSSPTLSINEIKNGIREVIIGGKICKSEEFRKSFLNPLFFKGIEQKEGEKKLEELRALVSVNTSEKEIEELFHLSDKDMQKVQEESSKTFASSNEVREKHKEIATLPKNKITKRDIVKLIGLSHEDQETLLKILAKDPPPNVESEEVKKKFESSLELKEKIIKNIKIDKKSELGKLINVSKEEQDAIWKIINLPPEKKTEEGNRKKIEEILGKCPKSLEEYRPIYEGEYNKKYGANQRSQADIENAQSIIDKVIYDPDAFKNYQEENRAKIKAILLREQPIIQEKEFDLLLKTLCYTDSLINKIKAKYKNILSQNSNLLEGSLNVILDSIDENITPLNYLKTVLENSWLSPDERLGYFQHLIAEAQLDWKDFQPLYEKKRNHSLTLQDIESTTKKFDSEVEKLNQLKSNFIPVSQEYENTEYKIGKINNLKVFIKNLEDGEPDTAEKDFRGLVEAAKLNWKDFQYLYERKRDHLLTQDNINETIKKIDELLEKQNHTIERINNLKLFLENIVIKENNEVESNVKNLVEELNFQWSDFQFLYEKKISNSSIEQEDIKKSKSRISNEIEKIKNLINKINNLKDGIKKLILLSEDSFRTLVEKAGYSYEGKFQDLYEIITYKSIGEPPLEQLKRGLTESIDKLGPIFEELGSKSLGPNRSEILRMSAEYLIEEIGPAAEKLVNRPDYLESEYLSTSRRNLYLIAMCRKAMAHYPLSIDEHLMSYLIDQLVLDTKIRLGHNRSTIEVLTEDIDFKKSRSHIQARSATSRKLLLNASWGVNHPNDFLGVVL